MGTAQLGAVLRQIRGLAAGPSFHGQSDGQLLRAFLAGNDEAAFAELVRRHGPLVLAVCRRSLGNVTDADDAFQATFLLLARRAASIRKTDSLASWLHGVAYRMANDARKAAARRRKHEGRAAAVVTPSPASAAALRELQTILDEEIQALPDAHREAFVLCCLEHHSSAEAAEHLGVTEANARNRLSRARKRLRQRLAGRGVSLTAALAAVALADGATRAAVPRTLLGATAHAAVRLAAGHPLNTGLVPATVVSLVEGVDNAMRLTKVTLVLLTLLTLGTAGVGVALTALPAAESSPARQRTEPGPLRKENPEAARPLALAGHSHGFQLAAFVDAGKSVLTVDYLRAHVCDASTGKERRSFKLGINCSAAALSPDGRVVAVGGWREFALYEVEGGEELWKAKWENGRSWGVAFSPDGKQVVSGDDGGMIRVWEAATGKEVSKHYVDRPPGGGCPVWRKLTALALRPGSSSLLYAALQGGWTNDKKPKDQFALRLRDLKTGEELELASFDTSDKPWHHTAVCALAFTADGKRVAAVIEEERPGELVHLSRLGLWDVETRQPLWQSDDLQKNVAGLAFAPDGRTLASVGYDGTVRMWEVASGKVRRNWEAGESNFGMGLTFTSDSRKLLTGVGEPRLWDVTGLAKRRPPTKAEELPPLWEGLADKDAEAAWEAVGALVAAPDLGVPFLGERLRAAGAAEVPRIKKLIGELDAEEFAARDQATKDLKAMGEVAWPAIRAALGANPGAESKRRLEGLLDERPGLIRSPEALRQVRAVEALELLGTPAARRALEGLVKDQPESWAAEQAKAALGRLEKLR